MWGNPRLAAVFRDTMEYIEKGGCKQPQTLVLNEDYELVPKAPTTETRIFVRNADSLSGAAEGALVLNFASGWTPGGGVVTGCKAQEEDICRRSSLYPQLVSEVAKPFYEINHRHPNISTDVMLLTKGVTVLKDTQFGYLEQPYTIDVLTVAAPRLTDGMPLPADELQQVLEHRIYAIVKTCAHHGYRRLVLGAWGCGAYRNDPKVVSALFDSALQIYGGYFDEVVFAIPGGPNYHVFASVFPEEEQM